MEINEKEKQKIIEAVLSTIETNKYLEERLEIPLRRLRGYALDPEVSDEFFHLFSNRYMLERCRGIQLGADMAVINEYDKRFISIIMLRAGGRGIQN